MRRTQHTVLRALAVAGCATVALTSCANTDASTTASPAEKVTPSDNATDGATGHQDATTGQEPKTFVDGIYAGHSVVIGDFDGKAIKVTDVLVDPTDSLKVGSSLAFTSVVDAPREGRVIATGRVADGVISIGWSAQAQSLSGDTVDGATLDDIRAAAGSANAPATQPATVIATVTRTGTDATVTVVGATPGRKVQATLCLPGTAPVGSELQAVIENCVIPVGITNVDDDGAATIQVRLVDGASASSKAIPAEGADVVVLDGELQLPAAVAEG